MLRILRKAYGLVKDLLRPKAAILVVHGGPSPKFGLWIELCLEMIAKNTAYRNYKVFVWNNNLDEREHDVWRRYKRVRVFHKEPDQEFANFHCIPLQILYERALQEGFRYFVTLDSDAFPVRPRWLHDLVATISQNKNRIGGVWRSEMADHVKPYIHPSCFAVHKSNIDRLNLRFDVLPTKVTDDAEQIIDVLAPFSYHPQMKDEDIIRWRRSNANGVHFLMAGVYGDSIYHHGAGSRSFFRFWNEPNSKAVRARNGKMNRLLTRALYKKRPEYLAWLRGRTLGQPKALRGILVLGMHRSGTSCLAGCLAASGIHMGQVSRKNLHNEKGNFEAGITIKKLEALFNQRGGDWLAPIEGPWSQEQLQPVIRHFRTLAESAGQGLWAAKDPRLIFFAQAISQRMPNLQFIGTYRPPMQVVRSLQNRDDSLNTNQCLKAWSTYNRALVELHKKYKFPIIKYNLSNAADYIRLVFQIQTKLGIDPNLPALEEFVSSTLFNAASEGEVIPEQCQDTYAYLEEHRVRLNEKSWPGILWEIKQLPSIE